MNKKYKKLFFAGLLLSIPLAIFMWKYYTNRMYEQFRHIASLTSKIEFESSAGKIIVLKDDKMYSPVIELLDETVKNGPTLVQTFKQMGRLRLLTENDTELLRCYLYYQVIEINGLNYSAYYSGGISIKLDDRIPTKK